MMSNNTVSVNANGAKFVRIAVILDGKKKYYYWYNKTIGIIIADKDTYNILIANYLLPSKFYNDKDKTYFYQNTYFYDNNEELVIFSEDNTDYKKHNTCVGDSIIIEPLSYYVPNLD